MVKIELSKDELYLIERDADIASSTASRNIAHLAEKLLLICGMADLKEPEMTRLTKVMVQMIEEHHVALDAYRGLRFMCEKVRGRLR